jgi:hypothetical protein
MEKKKNILIVSLFILVILLGAYQVKDYIKDQKSKQVRALTKQYMSSTSPQAQQAALDDLVAAASSSLSRSASADSRLVQECDALRMAFFVATLDAEGLPYITEDESFLWGRMQQLGCRS